MNKRMTVLERLLALLLFATSLVVAYYALVHWWWTVPTLLAEARIDRLLKEESELNSVIEARPGYARAMAGLERDETLKNGFFRSSSSVDAVAAELMQRIEEAAAAANNAPGCVLQSRVALPTAETSPGQVGVKAGLTCRPEGLATLVHNLETGSPAVFVRSLSVEGGKPGRDGLGLSVEIECIGYALQDARGQGG